MEDHVRFGWLVAVCLWLWACGSGDGGAVDAAAADTAFTDGTVEGDLRTEDLPTGEALLDVVEEEIADADLIPGETDVQPDGTADIEPEIPCDPELPGWLCDLPHKLPFEYTRPQDGEPLSSEEIRDFTKDITGIWKHIDYFNWQYEVHHGVDASTGYPEYLIWWHDVEAEKTGDLVTFRNSRKYGGSHNNAEPTGLALTQCIAGYLLTGDPMAGELVRQYALSFTAMMKGFMWDENDPNPYVMARNIVAMNHEFTLPSGKKKAVDYTDWYNTYEGWNAHRFHFPHNPTWGDIYVTTMRSKDDIPYMYRPTAWFPYVLAHSKDPAILEAVREAWDYMRGFARDIVNEGYYIRSKDAEGNAYIPADQDLASFVDYIGLIPDAECDARLSTYMLAHLALPDYDCGDGQGSLYDDVSGDLHYYNFSIVDGFHMNAVQLALVLGEKDAAEVLLKGLVRRIDRYRNPAECPPKGCQDPSWGRDMATLMLEAAALGMPLTHTEVRHIQHYYRKAVEQFLEFPAWDLWDDSVADGIYHFRWEFQPLRHPDAVRVEEIAFLLEYCWSPFRNPASAPLVDCDIVADPTRWGL